ncbi:MAG TPA: CRTAC1 family protein [Planctomycetaceae bacterium]|nr:CRTAC1 family protein [Planctomycetaceae bacterium]
MLTLIFMPGLVQAAVDASPHVHFPTGPKAPQEASNRRMAERLALVDKNFDPMAIPFFPERSLPQLREKLAATKNPRELLSLKVKYGQALLNSGASEDALREFEGVERLASSQPPVPELEARMLLMKALCYLRLGEQENCLANHNADSCLMPIRGGGVHQLTRGSEGAVRELTALLEVDPSPHVAWLLNIAYMTLGKYPDGVPGQWLIPPAVFESEYDIKRFHDVAGFAGVDVDELSGGVVMDDFDHDGFLDLMVSGSGLHSQLRLYRNTGDGKFTELTESAGLTGLFGGLNIIQGDYNNDGFVDVLVLRGGWLGKDGRHPHSLLRNNGNNTFTDVTEEAGLLTLHPTQTAVWFDYNNDGWLDIFIANETVPESGAYDPCELFRNNGNGTFTECAAESGVAVVDWVKAVVTGDFNNDGRPDLYLSSLVGPNHLLRNDGATGAKWHFTEVGAAAGVSEPLRSFSCWFWDYDNDGWLDLMVTGYAIHDAGDILIDYLGMPTPEAEHARLYHNNRNGTFTDVTKDQGVFKILHAMGANFGDLDNDGWLDFYVGTGDPALSTIIPNRMFRNNGGRGFQDVTTSGGFGNLQKGHGIAFGDVDNDGDEDIFSHLGGALSGDHYQSQLFENPGHGNHSIKLAFEGVKSNRVAIGARIKVVVKTAAGEREIHRVVGSGANFGASPLRQEIGLGQAQSVVRVEIFWPVTGKTQVVTGLAMDRAYAIREDEATPREVRLPKFAWPAEASLTGHHHHAMMPAVETK